MGNKWLRCYLSKCGEKTIGIVNAKNEEEARQILHKHYSGIVNVEDFELREIFFKNGYCEVYYGG